MGMEFLVPPEHIDERPGKYSDLRLGDIARNGRTGRVGRLDRFIGSGYGSDLFQIRYPSGKTRILSHKKLDRATPEEVLAFLRDEEAWQEAAEREAEGAEPDYGLPVP